MGRRRAAPCYSRRRPSIRPEEAQLDARTKRRREIGLGLLALALLGGLAWALRDPGAFGIGGAGERFVIPYDAALDLTAEDRVVSVAGPGADLTLTVSVAPRPVRALAEEAFTLRFAGRDGADAPAIDDVEITFNMEMDMGRHLYRPVRSGDTWRAQVVLPVCTWGGERWFARIRFTSDGERRETVLLFDIPLGGGDGG